MLAFLIIACEVGFWVLVICGLIIRYIFRKRRIGALLLLLTPVVDLLLLIIAIIDLRNGVVATHVHGLAAIYVGVSLAFGNKMISWADEKFLYCFANGPIPIGRPKHGREHALYERKSWYTHLLAWSIGSLLLYGMILFVSDNSKTNSLLQTIQMWGIILFIDFLYSFSFTLWPRK
ncbi:hypothetical protein [Clostridium beijerinckii]|uniref:Integral inner membrane protein n=1 Tax=Clostridium beijerinckii TaxID=1520 RepID=A0AAX0B9Q5_CLOBE|nr:hypothetical protein [Clostridium beijerinckii]MBA8933505.1 hypothetical protein [Clostridium beijerinckii]NOW05544.1 hypothetical protein [Clostridium beijerinckii]NRT36551.1 hypothetical protein [Clostridium beijerinckii]NRT44017.1 hypothetical protein [Clostridium beijerinckii]NRT91924.1 hypothetical protein [Clostridium beijerinckii]